MRILTLGCVAFASVLASLTPAMAQYQPRGGYGSGGGFGTGSNPSSHGVEGYTTPRGTQVDPYVRTNPNGTQYDNFGTRGNVNPNTGSYGTRTPRY